MAFAQLLRERPAWAWVLAVLVVGSVRFYGLMDHGLEWDEAHLVAIAKLPLGDILRTGFFLDHHPPGVAVLLHGWLALLDDTDLTVRLFTWAFGLLGLWGTYLLAFQITASKKTALLTTGFSVFAAYLWLHSHITTFYNAYYAGVIFSWFFFLQWMNGKRSLWPWLFCSVVTIYLHTAAAVFLSGQVAYGILQWKTIEPVQRKTLLVSWLLMALVYAPYIWLLLQPWHMSHIPWAYPGLTLPGLLILPVNLTWLGYDLKNFSLLPPVSVLFLYAVATYAALWASIRYTRQHHRGVLVLLFCMGVLPATLLFLLSVFLKQGVLQLRTVLYMVFAMHLLWALWLAPKKNAVWILIAAMLVQIASPFRFKPGEDTGKWMAELALPDFKPGDGVVVYPGWMGLVFLRYLDPDRFGLGEQERNIDPLKENYFSMVNRIDDRYFMVSDQSVLYRPDVVAAFNDFQKQHDRIWILADPFKVVEPLLDCKRTYILWAGDGNYHWIRCHELPENAEKTREKHAF